ncbi:hypothetical protein VHUM_04102 [Vanrija humicola]|uniref:Xylanolytic transcriptional activator regulatory domain-containing protein n=1 Tax=Vanrija humicola TaxID=5417 RepID=A0A7D8UW80_VANHU|nr:hypothetical protein VHUM_04102 [Vanrija humicola]
MGFFHWPTFSRDVRDRRYLHDRAFYAATMAVCAIASARVRDGADAMGDTDGGLSLMSKLPPSTPPSEVFYEATVRAFPRDLSQAPEFDYKRSKVILAMLCIQYGQVRQLMTHLHDYITLSAADAFHLESRWPPNLPETELQERRRLFWAAYTIDVYSATTWGGIVSHREAQSTVLYPAEVYDDDEITPDGIVRLPGPNGEESRGVSFLTGWNFTSDLYRILEHALDDLRKRRQPVENTGRVSALYADRNGPSAAEVLDVVNKLYADLPSEFKGAKAMTGNLEDDRYGYQAADIIVCMQTVKMVMTGLEDASVEKRCAIAGELLDALATVPTAYIQAISSPMLHHLAGVGHLLGSVIQSPLSHWSYLQVRNVLLALADLLSTLESTLSFVPGIAEKLRDHVSRIDQYMTTAAMDRSRRAQVYHNALPPSAWTSAQGVNSASPSTASGVADSSMRTSAPPPATASLPSSTVSPGTERGGSSWQATPAAGPLPEHGAQTDEEYASVAGIVDDLFKPRNGPTGDAQFTLPMDLLVDWPFDMGEAFDFLGGTV